MPTSLLRPKVSMTRACVLAGLLVAGRVRSEPSSTLTSARSLYEEGKAAYDLHDFARAASAFARADELVPNATSLELALTSADKAGDAVLGMTLVDRAERRGLLELARRDRPKFADRTGAIEVSCPSRMRCSAQLDGTPIPLSAQWTTVGDHVVELDADGVLERFSVTVSASQVTSVRPTHVLRLAAPPAAPLLVPPTAAAPRRTADARVLSPAWFFAAIGATGVAGIATTLSGADTLSRHADFERDPADRQAAADGRAAETRTNVLLVTTAVFAIGAGVVGLFFTRWTTKGKNEVAYGL